MRFQAFVHREGSEYWSEIAELPGCFASGRTLTELHEALGESIGLYLWDTPAELEPVDLQTGPVEVCVRLPERREQSPS